jgi:alcohol dehydrogenase class IV
MENIRFLQPRRLAFGSGCMDECIADLSESGFRKVFLVTAPPTKSLAERLITRLAETGTETVVYEAIVGEPTVTMFQTCLKAATEVAPDVVIGLGGGSSLDVAKLVAALMGSSQHVREVFGIGLLKSRSAQLICLPTTSGTGSEVSPNAILLDEEDSLKKGVVSPFLVPDATYVDPALTVSLPPSITASTGIDALCHCIEAYTNKFAHATVDLYAIEGIRLASAYLGRAVKHGNDLEAREKMSLASLYGGLCLGPVNTGAVHALSYPLGGEFHIPHGVSNAVLLPHVMRFNAPSMPERYAEVAVALGIEPLGSAEQMAMRGADRVYELSLECGITMDLGKLNVPASSVPKLAEAAMKVTRLLKNNPRELNTKDAEAIYRAAYQNAAVAG